jgi:hypothetical protein
MNLKKQNQFTRSEFCVKQVEKTKPICWWQKWRKILYERMLCKNNALWSTKKQSQFSGLRPEIYALGIRNPNELNGAF